MNHFLRHPKLMPDDNSYTGQSASGILQKATQVDKAAIFQGGTQHPFSIQSMVIALDTATSIGAPRVVGFPFKSVYVVNATDTTTTVSLQPNTPDSFQSNVPLKLNDAINFDVAQTSCLLTWTAQSGKTITLVFFVDASFRSGSQISTFSGSLAVSEGSAIATTLTALANNNQTLVAAALGTRKCAVIQNISNGDVWAGPSTVTNSGATVGIRIPAGYQVEWRNTAALYFYSVGGGNAVTSEEA